MGAERLCEATQACAGADDHETRTSPTIETLPFDCLVSVLDMLPPCDVVALACTNRHMHAYIMGSSLWKHRCHKYRHVTNPASWPSVAPARGTDTYHEHDSVHTSCRQRAGSDAALHNSASSPVISGRNRTSPSSQSPRSSARQGTEHGVSGSRWASLCNLLEVCNEAAGLWTSQAGAEEDPKGKLVRVCWRDDCVEVVELLGHQQRTLLSERVVCRVDGSPSSAQLSLDAGQLTVASCRENSSPSRAVEAAAAVAHMCHADHRPDVHHVDPSIMGSSPVGSFASELLSFMQHSLGGPIRAASRRARARRRRPEGGRDWQMVLRRVEEHRVEDHRAAGQGSLGVWRGVYGPHGLEVVRVFHEQDMEGRAMIVAEKLLGDPNVPAGKVSWCAESTPLPEEAWRSEDWLDNLQLANAVVSLMPPDASSAPRADDGRPAPSYATVALHPDTRELRLVSVMTDSAAYLRVTAVHEGRGWIAGTGYVEPRSVQGALLWLDDGSIAFAWGAPCSFVVHMRPGAISG